jgi:hypothetical protein
MTTQLRRSVNSSTAASTLAPIPIQTTSTTCLGYRLSVFPDAVERLARQLGIANKMPRVPVAKVVLQHPGIEAVIHQLVTASVAQHVRMNLPLEAGRPAKACEHLGEAVPTVVNGAPRSEMNTNGDPELSRCSRRRARSSTPANGCTESSLPFKRRTWSLPFLKST